MKIIDLELPPVLPRTRVQLDCSVTPSLTKQSFKDECDINNILKKYRNTGLITHVQTARQGYGDFSSITDYQSAMNAVLAAQEAFLELPAEIRERFGNDPMTFVQFIDNPANVNAAVELGLKPKSDAVQTPAGPAGSQVAGGVTTPKAT